MWLTVVRYAHTDMASRFLGPIVVAFLLAASACSGSGDGKSLDGRGSTTSSSRPTDPVVVAGVTSVGRFVPSDALVSSVWDGRRVWLLDEQGRLLGIDGATGATIVDKILGESSGLSGLTLYDDMLLTINQVDPDEPVHLIQISVPSGRVERKIVGRGRPLGEKVIHEGTLLVADYELGVVSLDPQTAELQVLVNPGVIPNIIHPSGEGSFWVVNDGRDLLVRVHRDGQRLAEVRTQGYMADMAVDENGNAWLAERTDVTVFDPSGVRKKVFSGFKNAFHLYQCDGSIVASDVETGEIAWLSTQDDQQRRLLTNIAGQVVACAGGGGVWFITVDGDLVRLPRPQP